MNAFEYRIAGVVVLFDPPQAVAANIGSYVAGLERLYVVDNSDAGEPGLERQLQAIPNVHYIRNHGNPGQAHALNLGVSAALRDGADFVLTMDQDSRASPGMVERMLAVLDEIPRDQIGIVAPFHLTRDRPAPPAARWQDVYTTMTSGNLLNTAAFARAGPFLEGLFLDYVDNEYCMRLRHHGYRIIQVNGAVLEHAWGNMREVRLPGKTVMHLNYPPFRWYYITRNFLHVFARYRGEFPETYRLHRRFVARQALLALVFEPGRLQRLRLMIRGFRDYRAGRLGKLEWPDRLHVAARDRGA